MIRFAPSIVLTGLFALVCNAATTAAQEKPGVPEEARRQMRHNIDSSFVVFRDTVQEELKLTPEQKDKLEVILPDAMQFFQSIQGLKPEERKKELKAYRPKAREKLAAVLKETLNDGQRKRLRQIVLQREGLRNGEIWKDLQVTDEQQKQFIPLMRQAQQEIQTLMEEIQKTGKLKELQPRVIKVRDDLEGKLEALLTDAQKKQWKDMLGKPMALADLFDL
jgi:Spy/CpxP family protein refolding chaperone